MRENLARKVYGKLLVVKPAPNRGTRTMWECLCSCGRTCAVFSNDLKRGRYKSCGCNKMTQGGHTRKHPLWKRWCGMISRCETSVGWAYKYYGSRGIKVCERWRKFENFLADMEATFFEGGTIDRINNDGDYEPSNCRWATMSEQNGNRRSKERMLQYDKYQNR